MEAGANERVRGKIPKSQNLYEAWRSIVAVRFEALIAHTISCLTRGVNPAS